MGCTFSIAGVAFDQLSSSPGRKALFCIADAPEHQVFPYHPPGVNGTYKTFGGLIGVPITARMRYKASTLLALHALYDADKAGWAGLSFTIVDESGISWDECRVLSMKVIRTPTATGRTSPAATVHMDVEATFVSDAGVSQ